MLTLTPTVLQLVALGIQVAPQIVSAAITEVALLQAGTPPSVAQKAAIDAALEAAAPAA
jgi:hypothetical protein